MVVMKKMSLQTTGGFALSVWIRNNLNHQKQEAKRYHRVTSELRSTVSVHLHLASLSYLSNLIPNELPEA